MSDPTPIGAAPVVRTVGPAAVPQEPTPAARVPWPVWLVLGAASVSLGVAALQAYRVLDGAGTTVPSSSEVADLPTRVAVLVQVIAPDRQLLVPLLGLVAVAGLLRGCTGTTPGHRPARLAASALAALVALGAGCLLGLLAYVVSTTEAEADEERFFFFDERFLVFGGPSATSLVVLCVAVLLVHHLVLTPAPVAHVDDDPDQGAGSSPPQPGPGQVARVDGGPERDEQVVAVREEPKDPHAPFRRPH